MQPRRVSAPGLACACEPWDRADELFGHVCHTCHDGGLGVAVRLASRMMVPRGEGPCPDCPAYPCGCPRPLGEPVTTANHCCTCRDRRTVLAGPRLRVHEGSEPVGLDTEARLVACPDCGGGQAVARVLIERQARIPAQYGGMTLDRWEESPGEDRAAFQEARRWLAQAPESTGRPFLVLSGPMGCGKTALAVALLYGAYARFGLIGQLWTAPEIMRRIRAGFDARPGEERSADAVRTLKRLPLLVLDDLGAEQGTDFAEAEFFDLLDTRLRSRRPTVITTNLRGAQLPERIWDRLQDGTICRIVPFQGGSRRKGAAR